jgi:polyhydroxyalkanoate synthase
MPSLPPATTLDPRALIDLVRRDVERNALRARNGIRLATGADRPAVGQTPKDVVWKRGRSELWHYRDDGVRLRPPLLLIVFSPVSRSYILDLSPGNSFVERLLGAGFDVYLLDWGVPDERDAQNALEDYVDYLPAGIDRVLELSGCDAVTLLGYCFGGDLALLHAAHHRDSPLRSLTVMATPVDFRHMGPLADVFARGGLEATTCSTRRAMSQIILQGFRSLTPTSEVTR